MKPFERMAADIVDDEPEYRSQAAEAAKLVNQATQILSRLSQGIPETDDTKLKGNVEAIYPELDKLAFKLTFALRQDPDPTDTSPASSDQPNDES
jgi:hypothetical protein